MTKHDYPNRYFPVDAPNTGYRFDTYRRLPWQTLEELRDENKRLYWARYQALLNRYSCMLVLVIWFIFTGMVTTNFQSFSWDAVYYCYIMLLTTGFSILVCYIALVFKDFLFRFSGDVKNWLTGRDIR